MSLGLARNKKYHQGYYYPENKEKYVGDYAIYRSGLELQYFKFLDKSPKCVKWNSEGIKIPYFWEADQKWHNYYVDLAATFKEGTELQTYLIEIKPFRQTQTPQATSRKRKKTLLNEQAMYSQNQAKWHFASKFALENGFKFIVLTEKDIRA
jgi:hypothetical protein